MEDISIEAGAVFVPTSLHRDNRRQFVPWVKSFQLFKLFSTNSHQDRVIYATELISDLEYSKNPQVHAAPSSGTIACDRLLAIITEL
ncbi:unnamed protein product [Caenorhabditis brenneri]